MDLDLPNIPVRDHTALSLVFLSPAVGVAPPVTYPAVLLPAPLEGERKSRAIPVRQGIDQKSHVHCV
jgi:hypothetical protein